MNRAAAVAALVVVASVSALLSELPLRAPLSGITLATAALGLVAIGYAGRSVYALGLAAVCVAISVTVVVVLSYSDDTQLPTRSENCDPSCGIPLGAFVLMTAVVALALASAGWVARALIERWRT